MSFRLGLGPLIEPPPAYAPRMPDGKGLPLRIGITAGQAHDNRLCSTLLSGLASRTMLMADRGYDAGWIRALVNEQGVWANIPPKRNRRSGGVWSKVLQDLQMQAAQVLG